ncbi:hypothetical protein Pelo_7522 [Pelomyxa schiedti]|nr:hypothetical protein Pelo_7522 [Pelomyxa schiedti]
MRVFELGLCFVLLQLCGLSEGTSGQLILNAPSGVQTATQGIGTAWSVTVNATADTPTYWPQEILRNGAPTPYCYYSSLGSESATDRLTIDLLKERNITSMLLFSAVLGGYYSMLNVEASAVNGITSYPVTLAPKWTAGGPFASDQTAMELYVNRKVRYITILAKKTYPDWWFYMGKIHFYECATPCSYPTMLNSGTCACISLPQCDRYVRTSQVNQWSPYILSSQSGFTSTDTLTITFVKPIVNGEGPLSILTSGGENQHDHISWPSNIFILQKKTQDVDAPRALARSLSRGVIFNTDNFETLIVNSSAVLATRESTPIFISIPKVIELTSVQINVTDPYLPAEVNAYVQVKEIVNRQLRLEFYTTTLSPYDLNITGISQNAMFLNQTLTHQSTVCTLTTPTCQQYWLIQSFLAPEVCIFEGQPLLLPFNLLCLSGASCSFMVNGVEKRNGTLSIPLWSPDLCGSVQVNASLTGTMNIYSDSSCTTLSTSFKAVPPTFGYLLISLASTISIDSITIKNLNVIIDGIPTAIVFNGVNTALATTSKFSSTNPWDAAKSKMQIALEFNINWLTLEMGEINELKFNAELNVNYKTAKRADDYPDTISLETSCTITLKRVLPILMLFKPSESQLPYLSTSVQIKFTNPYLPVKVDAYVWITPNGMFLNQSLTVKTLSSTRSVNMNVAHLTTPTCQSAQ